ncbi:tyrosine-type recombinase/integrase [Parasphingorhabdus sp.]|uniref:tyrosine-type recombinase/integrase n=1 Tax=Parasphingorhabdus sp. TaxID=2709688 RepID=UPI003001196D
MGNLTATAVKATKAAGRYGDGDGLYLVVGESGSRSWMVRVQKDGRRRDIGLGSAKKVSLAIARDRATIVRSQVELGIDPIAERRKSAGIPTFREAAALVYAEQRKAWKNKKHNAQWISSLEAYAFPAIGDRAVNQIDGPAVRDILAAIWLTKNETATRVRQRINTIIDWAVAKGYRDAPLSMAIINKSLPKVGKGQKKHFAAMPYSDVPEFCHALKKKESIGALALRAVILTAARSGEVRLATWGEIDFEAATWTIPAERMKVGREYIVPLSPAALAIFEAAKGHRIAGSDFVFQGTKKGKPLSDMTLTKIMRDQGLPFTVHGFRSSFRDWVGEETSFAGDVAEMALAHTIKDKTEAAYRRGSMFDKRRVLMDNWADYCLGDKLTTMRAVS